MPKKIAKKQIDAAVAELNKVRKQWLRRPGVTGVDVGYKISGNKLTDQLAVRVHVKRKLDDTVVERDKEAFSTKRKPGKCGAFPVDVIEAEYGPSQLAAAPAAEELEAINRKTRTDPLVGGISVGNPRVTAGTLGAIVWDRTNCKASILSNWHILCGSASCVAGEDIYQPGVFDGGTAADTVASLTRFRLDNHNDSALAELNGNRGSTRDIVGLSPIPGIVAPALGMNVIKSGRTTEVTEGVIDGVSLSTTLNYGGGVVNAFQDQIHIVPRPPWPAVDYEVSKGGDSGSVWIQESSGNAVGLHFAGETASSPSAEHAVANQMVHVAADLDFSFTPLFCRPTVTFDDDRLRVLIRLILCRRYPWLCGGMIPFPPRPPFNFGQSVGQSSGCGCGGDSGGSESWERQYGGNSVEDVIDEIVAQIKAAR